MAGVSEFFQQKALETSLATRNQSTRRTTGQQATIDIGGIFSRLGGNKKQGDITYRIGPDGLFGSGKDFSGTFTRDDLSKFTPSQFRDVASQLGIEGEDDDDIRVKVFDAIRAGR